jgi:hypothetical protein
MADAFEVKENDPKPRDFEVKRNPRANILEVGETREEVEIHNSEPMGNMPCCKVMSSRFPSKKLGTLWPSLSPFNPLT